VLYGGSDNKEKLLSCFSSLIPCSAAKRLKKKKSKKKEDPLGEVNNGIVVFDSYILGQLSIIFLSVLLVSPMLSLLFWMFFSASKK
jgi:hypothetical protein